MFLSQCVNALVSSECHAYPRAPNTSIGGKYIARFVKNIVNAEIGTKAVAELLANDKIHKAEIGITRYRSPADLF